MSRAGRADELSPARARRSLPGGLLPNNTWVGVCGTIAAIAQLKGVWLATA